MIKRFIIKTLIIARSLPVISCYEWPEGLWETLTFFVDLVYKGVIPTKKVRSNSWIGHYSLLFTQSLRPWQSVSLSLVLWWQVLIKFRMYKSRSSPVFCSLFLQVCFLPKKSAASRVMRKAIIRNRILAKWVTFCFWICTKPIPSHCFTPLVLYTPKKRPCKQGLFLGVYNTS